MTHDLTSLLQRPDTTIAVVGATDDPSKYGAVIYRDLKRKGFTVYAVNPNRSVVDGDPAYASLADLPEDPTIVNLVVPGHVGLRVLDDAAARGLRNIWVQPGAESPALLTKLHEGDFAYLANACVMVESRLRT